MTLLAEISKLKMNELEKWFHEYVSSFLNDNLQFNLNIRLKRDHSVRVQQEMRRLAKKLNLNANEVYLAEILGLFHDIGRFEQLRDYRTFMDCNSTNHAILGVRILKEQSWFINFPDDIRSIIEYAIGHHNAKTLPFHKKESYLFFARLLRDGDKLDILRVVTDYYEHPDPNLDDVIVLNLPDSPSYAPEIIDELLQGKIVSSHFIRTRNDFKLLQMGWIYDVNFSYTLVLMKEREYLKKIKAVLPDTSDIHRIYRKMMDKLESV